MGAESRHEFQRRALESSPLPRTMSSADASPPVPPAFVIAVFAVAIVVAGIIAYFGFAGHLGAGIP